MKHEEFDVIVVGSGVCGATIAREMSRQGRKVLMLERGGSAPARESLAGIAGIADEVRLGERKLATVRALTTGGSTSMYFAVANMPPLELFRTHGIELADDLEAVRRELPIAALPDRLLTAKARRLRASAIELGHDWRKNEMLIDASRCDSGYRYEAKWKALDYVEDALAAGATLIQRAMVVRVLREGGRAIGVEYRRRKGFGSELRQAYAGKVVLAAGELATPTMLRDCGVDGVGARGFFCNPGYGVYGLVPGLGGGEEGFVGSMSCHLDDGIELGDANVARVLHRPMMLAALRFRHLLSYGDCVGVGVKVKDGLGGRLEADGRLRKGFDHRDQVRLDRGRREAVRLLERAGAKHIFDVGLRAAGRIGGLIRIGEHVDGKLETSLRGLHVCDGSIIPDDMRGTPTVSLICLARHLSRHLLAAT